MSNTKPAKTLAALRQLACLGLPGKAILPEVMQLLRTLVDFDVWGVFYLNNYYEVADAYAAPDVPVSVLIDYAENFHNSHESALACGMTVEEVMKSDHLVFPATRAVDRKTLHNTEFWNRIMRPINMEAHIQIPIRDGSRPIANIILGRSQNRADFSPQEIRTLEQASPWLCHAFSHDNPPAPPNPDEPTMPMDESGILILDSGGRIEWASLGAIALIHQAAGIPMVTKGMSKKLRRDVETMLASWVKAICSAINGKTTPFPGRTTHNQYGSFHLRGYALTPFQDEQPPSVSLYIERHAPLSQRLFRSSRFMSLSPRERDICLSILAGHSSTETARRLGLKPSSVIRHTKQLYMRLDISGQKELLQAVLADTLK